MKSRTGSSFDKENVNRIKKRISEKIADYENYSFSKIEDCSLKTFFDLAQEFDHPYEFYCICVLIPKIFFNYESVLYLAQKNGSLKMVCHTWDIYNDPPGLKWDIPDYYEEPVIKDHSFFIPIKGNIAQIDDLPQYSDKRILGIFEIYSDSGLSKKKKFFLEKYVNRIGFQLHNRMIHEKNKEHLMFIHNLVNDIGHNIIVPNMYYKLFFRRMKGKLDRAKALGAELLKISSENSREHGNSTCREIARLGEELDYINGSMDEQFQQILSHYEQTSLFLETLLRRSHFEHGHYVIEPKLLNVYDKIIQPQLSRYQTRLQEKNIGIDNRISATPGQEVMVVADIGLISQAYANLFSNTVKYTREVFDMHGKASKFISFWIDTSKDFFGDGKDGVKFNMFSTGPHLSPEDAKGLFQEGYRGKNVEDEYGTGHGLQFIKEVVELHGGKAGYEPVPMGNNFFFILPK